MNLDEFIDAITKQPLLDHVCREVPELPHLVLSWKGKAREPLETYGAEAASMTGPCSTMSANSETFGDVLVARVWEYLGRGESDPGELRRVAEGLMERAARGDRDRVGEVRWHGGK